ncbi:hypothetical protein IFM89_027808 [Coptis chinensis]|uniref:Ubiquitin-like domain-containing protein n=1 Tax=Coptis chinensis TaxID=261450 RepID=A0A835IVK4_9MAGN|nr:hypothetical protein IFM89_027808 [Coptis chinensis]
MQVRDLRNLTAEVSHLPVEHLKLILRGEVLYDTNNGDDVHLQLEDKDSIIVAVKPKSPTQLTQDGFDDDEDDELKFQIPQSTSRWKRKIFSFLHDKLKLPYILLTVIFSISLRAWALIILWFMLAPVAYRCDLGPLYILGTGFCIILFNLGKREDGELSKAPDGVLVLWWRNGFVNWHCLALLVCGDSDSEGRWIVGSPGCGAGFLVVESV